MQRWLRLQKSQHFERLRQEGFVYRHPFLLLSMAPNQLPHNRYGLVTGKPLGSAVKRNRVRRVLREVLRNLHPTIKTGYDIILIARAKIVEQPFVAVRQAVYDMLQRAALLAEE